LYLGFAGNRRFTAARFLALLLLVAAVALCDGCTSTGLAGNPPFGGIGGAGFLNSKLPLRK
jgi:hypothetical protein